MGDSIGCDGAMLPKMGKSVNSVSGNYAAIFGPAAVHSLSTTLDFVLASFSWWRSSPLSGSQVSILMPRREIVIHGVQFFVVEKGKISEGRSVHCKTPEEACRLAAEQVESGRVAGAAAFVRRVRDVDYEDGSEPITLATFGRVPPGVADQIPF